MIQWVRKRLVFLLIYIHALCTLLGSLVAYRDEEANTIRHVNCQYLLKSVSSGNRCNSCVTFRNNTLRRELNRMKERESDETRDPASPSSHTNYRFLTTPERNERMQRLHKVVRAKTKSLEAMRKGISRILQNNSVKMDSDTHNDLLSIMRSYTAAVNKKFGEESFQALFWQQQLQASSLGNLRSMRWHPVMIKWCLLLHRSSSRAYEMVRKTGVFHLPSGRTLRDYTHFAPAMCGFNASSDQQLLDAASQTKPHHLSKQVVLLVDEMYVKEGLVFDKTSGALVGYVDLGDINGYLRDFEHQLAQESKSSGTSSRPVAKTVAVFMVRGLFSSLQFPYAVFPSCSIKGSDLFPLLWEAIGRLTRNGFHVFAVTADGCKSNRKLFQLHSKDSKPVYKVENVFSPERHMVYFICDPPHLLKTIRNCLASDKRNLWVCTLYLCYWVCSWVWNFVILCFCMHTYFAYMYVYICLYSPPKIQCNGQNIRWDYIIKLYERNVGAITETPGLSMVPKLKYEHIKLTSFSKMRVDLAAEVTELNLKHNDYHAISLFLHA